MSCLGHKRLMPTLVTGAGVRVQVENGRFWINIRPDGSKGGFGVEWTEVTGESQRYWSYKPHMALLRDLI